MRVYAIVAGVEHSLNDDGDLAQFFGEDGLGSAPLHRLSERGPLQHGETDLGYRLDPRQVSYVFHLKGSDPADLWDKRRQMTKIFHPAAAITMKHELPNGTVRCLDCHYAGGMGMSANDRLHRYQRVAVTLRAPDPTLYDPVGQAVTFALSAGGSGFEIPTSIPHGIGASTIDQSNTIEYLGSASSFPHLVRIVGPITDAQIENLTTGEVLDFTGITIVDGDYYDIDLRYGRKTVKNAAGVNKIADLASDSDLATWHIAPADEAPGGINDIRVTGSGANTATRIEIAYYIRDLGV
jgi:hypothetical protein